MADSFGLKIGLEGEKEFKKALADINQAFKVLGSEMKLATSQFDKNDKSVEALAARNKVLRKEIDEQTTKIDTLRKALQNAATSFGENDRRTQNWQIQLNNAEAALNDMNRELDENEKAIKEGGKAAEESGSKFEGFGKVLKTVGVALGAVAVAAGAAAVKLGKEVIAAYADYEQLVGGVDTLFKDSSQEIQRYAANAYKTAGLSANEYMETVTGFSASLIQSLGGDTEKAAKYADMAITDMSDNANKMGTDMSSIQNAYQGFAKQNYTMLDNLKLGYPDEGITGTNTKKREQFRQMVADALDGKIDLIITKSVSRFARNTVDSLTTIRKLKEHNVEVYFEKENIWTFDSKGELLLTIMSSLAQEESRSISENCTWGQRKRFADGKVTVLFKRFLGYDMGSDHNLVVNPEQAKLVKRIYGMFLQSQSPFQIARTLTEEGIPSPGGKDHWNPSNIKSILTNEKYKGDALLQKSFTVDFLTKKKKTNEGEIPQYYVKDNHEAIIDPETFEMVQTLMTTRTKGRNRKSSVSIFSSKVKCGDCGSWYGPKVWHSNDAYRKVIWQCNHKFDGQKCATPTLTEDEIKELFLRATNQVIDQKEQFIAIYEQVLSRNLDTTALESELSDLEAEINIAAELIEECIKENAHVALDQDEYQKRYDALVARFDKAKARHTEVTDLIAERMARKHQIESYLKELRSREPLTEFRETDWLAMVDYITVHSKKDIWATFKDGNEIKA